MSPRAATESDENQPKSEKSDSLLEISFKPGEELLIRLRAPDLEKLKKGAGMHATKATKEVLTALQHLIEEALVKVETIEKPPTKKTTIKVE